MAQGQISAAAIALLVIAILVLVLNQFLIGSITAAAVSGVAAGGANAISAGANAAPSAADAQKFAAEFIPRGTPAYGQAASLSFDNVDGSLQNLLYYHQSIQFSDGETARYIRIGTTRNTACEFCCGVGDAGFIDSAGQLTCGCAHNIAFSGLAKWMIKNTDYSDGQILEEIAKWKVAFFPGPALQKALIQQGIDPSAVGMPQQVGGC